jgi:hypothetical protein
MGPVVQSDLLIIFSRFKLHSLDVGSQIKHLPASAVQVKNEWSHTSTPIQLHNMVRS